MASAALKTVRPTRPMIEPMALPTYFIIAVGAAASAILVPLGGFTIDPSVWPIFFLWPFVAFSGMLLRRVDHPKAATAVEATALIYGQGLAYLLMMFPVTALGAPLADGRLAAADHALGFNWSAYAWALAPVIDPLVLLYKSFDWQPLLVVALLVSRPRRLWVFTAAAAIALLLATIIYPFVPADGAWVHYGLHGYPMKGDGPAQFGRVIHLIRGGERVIRLDLLTGFVSFPSYHAASAVLFVWALWSTKLRIPAVILNVLVCGAAIVVGGHYLVDILGGLAVGALATILSLLVLRSPADDQNALAARRLARDVERRASSAAAIAPPGAS